jgi:hypothetical protein
MRHTASAVSGSYTGQFAAPKATPRWVWWVGGLFVLGAIGAAIDEQVKQAKSNQSSTVNTPISASSSATPQGSTGREITSAERLSEAKNSLADNRLADTRRALEAIKPGDPEYAEAQALLEQVKRREGRRRR